MAKKNTQAPDDAASTAPTPPQPTTAVTDPLEAAKIAAPPSPIAPPDPDPAPVLAGPSGDVEPARPSVKKYTVVETTSISLHGQIIRLNKGDVVSESSYGPDGMQRIMESNVALAELKE